MLQTVIEFGDSDEQQYLLNYVNTKHRGRYLGARVKGSTCARRKEERRCINKKKQWLIRWSLMNMNELGHVQWFDKMIFSYVCHLGKTKKMLYDGLVFIVISRK
jgi:hypothetical protein